MENNWKRKRTNSALENAKKGKQPSIKEKYEIIQKVEKIKQKQTQVAFETGCSKSTICKILSEKDKIIHEFVFCIKFAYNMLFYLNELS